MEVKEKLLVALDRPDSNAAMELARATEEWVGASRSGRSCSLQMARFSQDCGLNGVVTSALEIRSIRETCGAEFKILVPGNRRPDCSLNHRQRTASPA